MKGPLPSSAVGLEILRRRQAQSSDVVFNALTAPLDLSDLDLSKWNSVITTGVGSSSAHARYLAWLLQKYAGLSSWDVSAGAFLHPPGAEARHQALVVFSQGLSPNARFPLSIAGRFGCTVLVTAAGDESGERAEALRRVAESGVIVIRMPVAPEYEVLLRILGPLAGYAVALRLAAAQKGVEFDLDARAIAAAVASSSSRATALLTGSDRSVLSDPITFVAAGGYGALASNLCFKVTEGMFLNPPSVVDALEFAHGPMQQASGRRRTFIALGRNAPHEAELFARVRQVLEPQHRWIELRADLPEPLQIFEHESGMNALVLAAIAERGLDQREWPGKGRDGPLYSVASVADLLQRTAPTAPSPQFSKPGTRRLDEWTWQEVEDRVRAGERTVVVPLGATEQHGPHLPLAVDSMIADALAERFCSRIPHAMHAPAIRIGCSSEHMDFCGTLSLSASTLRAVLMDTLPCFVRHGFAHIVLFSAHGGNDHVLAEIEPDMRRAVSPALLTVVHGIEQISAAWLEASAQQGISAEASGAHAGEFETSIIAALRPEMLRWEETRVGISTSSVVSQELFYPSLRNHAPDGVVGDPRLAVAERAEHYLSAWVDVLVAAYQQTIETAK